MGILYTHYINTGNIKYCLHSHLSRIVQIVLIKIHYFYYDLKLTNLFIKIIPVYHIMIEILQRKTHVHKTDPFLSPGNRNVPYRMHREQNRNLGRSPPVQNLRDRE